MTLRPSDRKTVKQAIVRFTHVIAKEIDFIGIHNLETWLRLRLVSDVIIREEGHICRAAYALHLNRNQVGDLRKKIKAAGMPDPVAIGRQAARQKRMAKKLVRSTVKGQEIRERLAS